MAYTRVIKTDKPKPHRDESGIALFMVIGAIAVLTVLVTEFTYIAQVGQMIAFGGLDQTKAHYLAKSGLKLSLLRLKAYKQVKEKAGAAGVKVPKAILEKIWSFPLFYPFPTNIPGMTGLEKEVVEKFNKDTGMEGEFSTHIASESSKYNLNMLLAAYSPLIVPTVSPSPGSTPSPTPTFNPEAARQSLTDYLEQILKNKSEADPDFAAEYRDTKINEVVDNIAGWVDRTYERRNSTSREKIPMKKAPFYTISELHMVPTLDDELFNLFSPSLTTRVTSEINVNTMQEPTLTALVPYMTKDDILEFFKYRDSMDTDGQFKKPAEFLAYLGRAVPAYKNNNTAITQLTDNLKERNIVLTTEETEFKITVRAQVNKSVRVIEAWVSTAASATSKKLPQGGLPANSGSSPVIPDPGLRITYMRIL